MTADLKKVASLAGTSIGADVQAAVSLLKTSMAGAITVATKSASLFFLPLSASLSAIRSMVPYAITLATILTGIGAGAAHAAGGWEEMYMTTRAMVGSQKETLALMERASAIRAKTVFSDEDATGALVSLRNVGQSSEKAVQAVVDAAAATKQSMSEAAFGVMSMRARSLRQFGIFMSKEKDTEVLEFTTAAGKDIRMTAKNLDEARGKLIEALSMKFAGSADTANQTLPGIVTRIKNAMGEAMQDLGKGLLPSVKAIGNVILERLNKWIDSGKIKEFGMKAGELLESAIVELGGWIMTVPTMWQDVTKALRESPDRMKNAIKDALAVGAELLGKSLLIAIKGTAGFWVAAGQTIAGLFRAEMTNFLSVYGPAGIRGPAMDARRAQITGGALELNTEFRGELAKGNGYEAGWKEMQKRYDFLKGVSADRLGDVAGGNIRNESESTDFMMGLQRKSTNVPMDRIIGKWDALASKTTAEIKDAGIEAWAKMKKAVTASGLPVKDWSNEQQVHAKEIRSRIEVEKKLPGDETGAAVKKKVGAADVGAAVGVKVSSFSDYIKTAQEAVFAKMAKYAQETAENTGDIADKISAPQPMLVP
jgi:hypothetical protein